MRDIEIQTRQFRIPEAARLLNVSSDLLEGWHDRGLINSSGRDTSAPGHPYLISFPELIRLGVLAELQQLFREQLETRWNPGPFLASFREVVSDKELSHIPAPATPPDDIVRERADKQEQAARRAAKGMDTDVVLVLHYGKGSRALSVLPLHTLDRFRKALDYFIVSTPCWLVVNVSSVVRSVLARAGV